MIDIEKLIEKQEKALAQAKSCSQCFMPGEIEEQKFIRCRP